MKRIGRFLAEVSCEATNRQVHCHQSPSGRVRFLSVDADVVRLTAVRLDEFLGLHEHATRPAAWVVHASLVRSQHFDEHAHHRGRRIELPPFLAFSRRKLPEEVFVHLAEQVLCVMAFAETDRRNQVHQFAEPARFELRATETLVEDAFEALVIRLDSFQRRINTHADVRLLGLRTDRLPTRGCRHPKHVRHRVVVTLLQCFRMVGRIGQIQVVFLVAERRRQLRAALVERIGDVLQENQAEHDVLVLGGIHRRAQFVGCGPQGFLQVLVHGQSGIMVSAKIIVPSNVTRHACRAASADIPT
ncbi:Uncharacterised protein [Burkholderia pseudomallei]|nr:Uncharacterised protein [Burkholderia pseudomallei]